MQPLTITAVGDIMLGDSPQVFGFGVASEVRKHGADSLFDQVRPLLSTSDLTVANLEVVLSSAARTASFSERIYRGDPTMAEAIRRAGIDVVSVCTNHTMQHGAEAFRECVTSLLNAELLVSGADCVDLNVSRRVFTERKGVRIAVLSYNFRPIQYRIAAPAWPTPDLALIRSDVESARQGADIVMVTLHWGDEFISYPSLSQIDLARRVIDSGANIVVGHHPHIVQGVEQYRGGVIAYSLGNFVFDQWQRRLRRSMILKLTVDDPREVSFEIIPVTIDATHRPVPCAGVTRDEELGHHNMLRSMIGRATDEEYSRELNVQYKTFRREIAIHYLTSAWRFRPTDLLANVSEIIRRRL